MLRWRSAAMGAAALVISAAVAPADAQTQRTAPDEYTATTTNLEPGAGQKLSIAVLRWSSTSEREQVLSAIRGALAPGGEVDAQALEKMPTVGYIWTTGALGYSLKYAHRVASSDGGERVVLVTQRPLGSWDGAPWKAAGQQTASDAFTVVELRLDKSGVGRGTMSLAASIVVDETAKTVGLADPDKAAVLMEDVRRQPKPYWARES